MSDHPAALARAIRGPVLPAATVLLVALLMMLAGCSAGDGASAEADREGAVTVVDVRTPGEYASGHVPGSRNIDVESPGFGEEMAALSPDESYLVYCRTGNRSARAAEIMRAAGLTVEDGGGLADMSAAGYELTG